GRNVGFSFNGAAPDLGCFESAGGARAAVQEVPATNTAAGFAIYLNPVAGNATINYVLQQSARVQLGLYNAAGALIATLASGQQEAGAHTLPIDDRHLRAQGLYVLRLAYNNKVETLKFIK
ncbi:MAG TPA: T9SS type A sorting domain-containing protein, partial [Chitinophagaceae bacterium]|nr:T9SS type A sorting domain-containing protein [Chitinophagaceae bacterium]